MSFVMQVLGETACSSQSQFWNILGLQNASENKLGRKVLGYNSDLKLYIIFFNKKLKNLHFYFYDGHICFMVCIV